MTKQLERTDEITTAILERLEAGETITSICALEGMPSLSTFQRWSRSDRDFDDAILAAMTRGLFIQLHQIHDKQETAVNQLMDPEQENDPKSMQALATILRDQNHNKVALLTRLDKRFTDKQEVIHSGPMIIGWKDAADECPSCGHSLRDITPAPIAIDHDASLPVPANDATGGEAR